MFLYWKLIFKYKITKVMTRIAYFYRGDDGLVESTYDLIRLYIELGRDNFNFVTREYADDTVDNIHKFDLVILDHPSPSICERVIEAMSEISHVPIYITRNDYLPKTGDPSFANITHVDRADLADEICSVLGINSDF